MFFKQTVLNLTGQDFNVGIRFFKQFEKGRQQYSKWQLGQNKKNLFKIFYTVKTVVKIGKNSTYDMTYCMTQS
jgi:hypothetical protein